MKKWSYLCLFLALLVVTGCSQAAPTQELTAEAPAALPTQDQVIAEAVVEPLRWSTLSFEDQGSVAEILAAEGESVASGAVLLRLDPAEAEAAVQRAHAELASAEAQLAETTRGTRPEQLAISAAEFEAARAAVSQAAAQRDELQSGQLEASIAQAQADYTRSDVAAFSAEDIYEAFGYILQDESKFQLLEARAARAAAEAQLQAAQQGAVTQRQQVETAVWTAAAERDVAQAELDLEQAGATAEALAIAEARVAQAQAALTAAEAQLARTRLTAPFDGVVTRIDTELGETVTPGQTVAVVATLDALQLTTTDLTELDVVHVTVGQAVAISVDALPEQSWQGHVATIDLQSVDNRGDVTYPVTIALDEPAPELRWGMTALITMEKP